MFLLIVSCTAFPCKTWTSAVPTDPPTAIFRDVQITNLCVSLFQCHLCYAGKVSASTINAKSFFALPELLCLFTHEIKFVLEFYEVPFGQNSSLLHSLNKDKIIFFSR